MKELYKVAFIVIVSVILLVVFLYSQDLHNDIKQKQELDSLYKVKLKLEIQQLEYENK